MSDILRKISRRDLLRNVAVSAATGGLSAEAAQHVHRIAAEEKEGAGGVYQPKCFTAHEYASLEKLAGLIVPPSKHSQGALAAGAPEFIDLLAGHNDELAAIFTGGLAWLDREMERRHGSRFLDAEPGQRTALLDLIAWRKNDSLELGPGIRFFDWARRMTVDAYYTSRAGIEDLGYQGNRAVSEFSVPEEALQYALKRSGLV